MGCGFVNYLLGAGAGLEAVSAGLEAFLFFFTCFFVVVVAVFPVSGVAALAGACAASDKPAVARESPKSTAKSFFIVLCPFYVFCEATFSASVWMDERSINRA